MSRPFGFKHSEETKEKIRKNTLRDIIRICKNCGKEFKGKKWKKRKYCSRRCYYLFPKSEITLLKLSEKRIGEKHPLYGKHHSEQTKEKLRQYTGEKSSNWNGGSYFLPYCYKFNKKLKEKIRERDNRICQECGKTEIENGVKLAVHHIHYKKEDCDPDLIALCDSCNVRANNNRNYWEEYFMEKLNKRGLLKCKFL